MPHVELAAASGAAAHGVWAASERHCQLASNGSGRVYHYGKSDLRNANANRPKTAPVACAGCAGGASTYAELSTG